MAPLPCKLIVAVALLAGCTTGSARTVSPQDVLKEPGWLAVRGVPMVRQVKDADCGAAALAMVLKYWGVTISRDEIAANYPDSKSSGLRAGDMRDFARLVGMQAFIVKGEPKDLETELRHGRPVIVGLAKKFTDEKSLAHYEVLVGLNPEKRQVLTMDPAAGWRENTLEGFAAEWAPAEQLLLVVFK